MVNYVLNSKIILFLFISYVSSLVDVDFSKITSLLVHPNKSENIDYLKEPFFKANKEQVHKLNENSKHVTCKLLYRNYIGKLTGRAEVTNALTEVLDKLRYNKQNNEDYKSIRESQYNLMEDYVIKECKKRLNINSYYNKLNPKIFNTISEDEFDFINNVLSSYIYDVTTIVNSSINYRSLNKSKETKDDL